MEKRALGKSGIEVPPLVFGGNVFGWTADEAASFKLLDALVEAGFDTIDTADAYSVWVPGHQGGESETVIGNWLKRRGGRDKVRIFSKVGLLPGLAGAPLSAKTIELAVDASLQRLQTDYVDLYWAHRDDPTTPLDETLGAFARLVDRGKVRALGASNFSAPRLAETLAVSARLGLPRYEALQPHYNLVERTGYEAELEPLCVREGLGVTGYFSLAAGFLTGKYRTQDDLAKSPRGPRYIAKYLNDRSFRTLAAVEAAAKRQALTPAEIAIAWLIARPSVTAPIASATSLEQLQTLFAATRVTLDAETIATLDAASG